MKVTAHAALGLKKDLKDDIQKEYAEIFGYDSYQGNNQGEATYIKADGTEQKLSDEAAALAIL